MSCGCKLVNGPLMVFGEDDTVAECGECAEPGASSPPRRLHIERVSRTGVVTEREIDLSPKLTEAYAACADGGCLPWVRIQRDPAQFRAAMAHARTLGQVKDSTKIFELTKEYLCKQDQEVFLVVLLDTQLQVRGIGEIARGARDHVGVSMPDVLRLPLVDGASYFVVAHNHPSGKIKPSQADKYLTKDIARAGKIINIPCIDHLVVGPNDFYSFSDHNQL